MRKVFLIVLVALAAAPGAAGREPSASCSGGELEPGSTPAGIGLRQAGDPWQEPTSLYACGTGSPVPAPAKGMAWVRADTQARRVHVIADGDSDNGSRLRCADGFVAARAGEDGLRFYAAEDGSYTFNARERSPQEVVAVLAACGPATRVSPRPGPR